MLKLTLKDDRMHFAPGATVEGEAAWEYKSSPGWIELRLFWFTEGEGNHEVEIVSWKRWDNPAAHAHETFSFELPMGPYSFSGKLITLSWGLELVTARQEHAREEFFVGPHGEEILLHPRSA